MEKVTTKRLLTVSEKPTLEQWAGLGHLMRTNLVPFVTAFDPKFIVSDFHRFLAGLLELIALGQFKRVIINVPPRHGKTRMVVQEFVSWALGNKPWLEVVMASYSKMLTLRESRKIQARFNNPLFQAIFPGRLQPGNTAVEEWRTTEGGGFKGVGVLGGLVGFGADLLVIDDPIKDFADAQSPTIRENCWEWFWSVPFTRLNSKDAAIIIVQTRWHPDDLVGRLTDPDRAEEVRNRVEEALGKDATDEDRDRERWMVVNMPAFSEGEETDMLGRPEGEALFPEKITKEMLEVIKANQLALIWAAQYDGKPVPKSGNYVDAANFKIVSRDMIPAVFHWSRAWDLATDDGEENDFTAGVLGGFDSLGNLWLDDMRTGQWRWAKARANIISAIHDDGGVVTGVEAVGGFKTAFQNLKEEAPPSAYLREYGVTKDKVTRALPWFALAENQKVFLVDGPWVKDFKNQCNAFPFGVHDDMVDAVSLVHVMAKAAPKGATFTPSRGSRAPGTAGLGGRRRRRF